MALLHAYRLLCRKRASCRSRNDRSSRVSLAGAPDSQCVGHHRRISSAYPRVLMRSGAFSGSDASGLHVCMTCGCTAHASICFPQDSEPAVTIPWDRNLQFRRAVSWDVTCTPPPTSSPLQFVMVRRYSSSLRAANRPQLTSNVASALKAEKQTRTRSRTVERAAEGERPGHS